MTIASNYIALQKEIINVNTQKEILDFKPKLDDFENKLNTVKDEEVKEPMTIEKIMYLLDIDNIDIDMLVKLNNHINYYKNKTIKEVKVYEY